MASQLAATSSILRLDAKESTCMTYMNICNKLTINRRHNIIRGLCKNKPSSYHYGFTCCCSSCCGHLPWNEHVTKSCGDCTSPDIFYNLGEWIFFLPSGFANLCAPVGATIIGDGISYPNKFIDMSILLTSTRTRGLNLWNMCQKIRSYTPT